MTDIDMVLDALSRLLPAWVAFWGPIVGLVGGTIGALSGGTKLIDWARAEIGRRRHRKEDSAYRDWLAGVQHHLATLGFGGWKQLLPGREMRWGQRAVDEMELAWRRGRVGEARLVARPRTEESESP